MCNCWAMHPNQPFGTHLLPVLTRSRFLTELIRRMYESVVCCYKACVPLSRVYSEAPTCMNTANSAAQLHLVPDDPILDIHVLNKVNNQILSFQDSGQRCFSSTSVLLPLSKKKKREFDIKEWCWQERAFESHFLFPVGMQILRHKKNSNMGYWWLFVLFVFSQLNEYMETVTHPRLASNDAFLLCKIVSMPLTDGTERPSVPKCRCINFCRKDQKTPLGTNACSQDQDFHDNWQVDILFDVILKQNTFLIGNSLTS